MDTDAREALASMGSETVQFSIGEISRLEHNWSTVMQSYARRIPGESAA